MPYPDPSILLIHPDRKARRQIGRVLGGTLRPVLVADGPADARRSLDGAAPSVLVVAASLLGDSSVAELIAEARGSCLVVLEPSRREAAQLIAAGATLHLIATPMPALADELATSALKLLRGDLFGLEKYLAWGSEIREREPAATDARPALIRELSDELTRVGVTPRQLANAVLIADELLSNAIHNAPVDADGRFPLRDVPRSVAMPLVPADRPRLRWGFDARHLAIEVTDRYGSIEPSMIFHHIGKSADREMEIRTDGAGAGLGLTMVYRASSQLVFNVDPGRRTQVIGLVELAPRPHDAPSVSSFHLFMAGGARG